MWRALRREVARRVSCGAAELAPHLPAATADAVATLVARFGPYLPVLAETVAHNLRSAGIQRPGAVADYFAQVGQHFANGLRLFRLASQPQAVQRLAQEHITLDTTVEQLRALLDEAGGLVIAPPHVCNYLLTLVRLNQVIPLAVYLRWSKDPRRQALKERWCRAAGLEVILEPLRASDPTSRAMACVEAVRRRRALVMTPDLPQKWPQGVAIELFGRRMCLPAGPASIAMLADVPLVPVFGRQAGRQHHIYAYEPIRVTMRKRSEGGRAAALQDAMQVWSRHFESSLREQPQMWFFWADVVWTRVFRSDERYIAPHNGGQVAAIGRTEPEKVL